MYLRNKGNISLNKTRKLKRRRQNGGARGARHDTRDTIRSLMKRIATTISPPSVSLFTRKRSKASSKISPVVSVVPEQKRNSVSRKANSAESAKSTRSTTLKEEIRNVSAQADELIQEYASKAADTAEKVNKTMNDARTINSIISRKPQRLQIAEEILNDDASDDTLLAELNEELTGELTGNKSSKLSTEEEAEWAELVKSLSPQEQSELGIPTSKGGRRTRKQKKSRTRRRDKKSRKY
jgi:hypothetical protein